MKNALIFAKQAIEALNEDVTEIEAFIGSEEI